MSSKFNFSKFFGLDDSDGQNHSGADQRSTPSISSEHVTKNATNSSIDKKIVSIQSKQNPNSKIAIFEPHIYSDVEKIAKSLIDNNAVIVNFMGADNGSITRMIDFLSGAVYTLDGGVEKIGNRMFLFTPHKFEISGEKKHDLRNRFR